MVLLGPPAEYHPRPVAAALRMVERLYGVRCGGCGFVYETDAQPPPAKTREGSLKADSGAGI